MAKKPLRLNEVRVLLALKGRGIPLTIDEIVEATIDDTPDNEGISRTLVTRALDGVDRAENVNESTSYPGLLERGFVTGVTGGRFRLSLPNSHPNSGPEDEE